MDSADDVGSRRGPITRPGHHSRILQSRPARANLNGLTGRLRGDLAAAGIDLAPEAAAAAASTAVAGALERARAATKRVIERRAQAAELISRQQDAQGDQQVARLLGDLLRSDRFPRWLVTEAVDVSSQTLRRTWPRCPAASSISPTKTETSTW